MEELTSKQKLAVDWYIRGFTKKEACIRAGLSPSYAKELFAIPKVVEEIETRYASMDYRTDKDLEWLCKKLEEIINSDDPVKFDRYGRASLNFNKIRPELRKVLGKVVITTTNKKVKYGGVESESKYIGLSVKDKMDAMKELAILRGWRKEKLEVDTNEKIVDLVNKRRQELAGNKTDEGSSTPSDD